jgi:hypothetical protein
LVLATVAFGSQELDYVRLRNGTTNGVQPWSIVINRRVSLRVTLVVLAPA